MAGFLWWISVGEHRICQIRGKRSIQTRGQDRAERDSGGDSPQSTQVALRKRVFPHSELSPDSAVLRWRATGRVPKVGLYREMDPACLFPVIAAPVAGPLVCRLLHSRKAPYSFFVPATT